MTPCSELASEWMVCAASAWRSMQDFCTEPLQGTLTLSDWAVFQQVFFTKRPITEWPTAREAKRRTKVCLWEQLWALSVLVLVVPDPVPFLGLYCCECVRAFFPVCRRGWEKVVQNKRLLLQLTTADKNDSAHLLGRKRRLPVQLRRRFVLEICIAMALSTVRSVVNRRKRNPCPGTLEKVRRLLLKKVDPYPTIR